MANLPCICWVVQWSHVTALNLPTKGDFLIIFKFCPHFASFQPPGPEIWLLLVLRLHSWLSLQYLDAVMPNSQSHIAAIYRTLVNINRNAPYPCIQTHKTMQKLHLRTAVKLTLQKKTQNVLFTHTDGFVWHYINASFFAFDFLWLLKSKVELQIYSLYIVFFLRCTMKLWQHVLLKNPI